MISERSNQSLNITTLLGKGCSTDDEAIFLLLVKKIRRSVWDERIDSLMMSPAAEC